MKVAGKTGRIFLLAISGLMMFMVNASCKRHATKYGPPPDIYQSDTTITKYGVPIDYNINDSTPSPTKYGAPTPNMD